MTDKGNSVEVDMSKVKSKEKESFFAPMAMKLAAVCIIILGVLAILFVITILCGKDGLASSILDIIKVLVGAIFGGVITQAALKQ